MLKFRKRTIHEIADMICGNDEDYFVYRSSSYLTQFFEECDMENYVHDGSTRKWWVSDVLMTILKEPSSNSTLPGIGFQKVIEALMDRADYMANDLKRKSALNKLNISLNREGLEAFYDVNNRCCLRNKITGDATLSIPSLDRALSAEEITRRRRIEQYMDTRNEDEITENILLPLFQTLKFQRISIAGHKDKSMEFGKDLWMKFSLPIRHLLYFGLQVKRGKIDAKAQSSNVNVATLYNQITMMLGHEIFDPDINKKRLVDHAIIVTCGEITKQAKHWLGEKLDASQRSQILFLERSEIIHLFVVHNVPMPDENYDEKFSDQFQI